MGRGGSREYKERKWVGVKYLKYLKYILKHKWYVFIECYKAGIPIRGLLHDISKLFPSEFFAYTDYFYGKYAEFKTMPPYFKSTHTGKTKESVKIEFDMAWLHHQKRNKHHWQYWMLQKDNGDIELLPMPEKYRKEMLADWRGAGKAITGKDDTKQWYCKNRKIIKLNPSTRSLVESDLGLTDHF